MSLDFSIELATNPDKHSAGLHGTQVWLHTARVLGSTEVGAPKQISFLAKSADGRTIGGLLGSIKMRVLHVDSLWVEPDHQRNGVGSSLFAAAVSYAKSASCEYVIGIAYDHKGSSPLATKADSKIEIVAKIENCPTPHTLYFLQRKL